MHNSSGTTTEYVYDVEVRYNYHYPRVVAGVLLDDRWRSLPRIKGSGGVPVNRQLGWCFYNDELTYEAAQALRWWFLSKVGCDDDDGSQFTSLRAICVETRIVRRTLICEYKIVESGVDYIDEVSDLGRDATRRAKAENSITDSEGEK